MSDEFITVIGLEVHVQLKTEKKIWCNCKVAEKEQSNKNTCEVCLAHPGALPVLNQKVLEFGVRTGLALNCEIDRRSTFDRKNYFYPDLTKGYQITQFFRPIATEGFLKISSGKKIGIERVQIEEDTGKSTHFGTYSLIDYNRGGAALLEIVGKPEIRNKEEAVDYLKSLHLLVKYLGVSDAQMEEGQFRCDVNLSLMRKEDKKFGTRTEVKNLNSFKNVEKAIEAEFLRQSSLLRSGEKVSQETLGFDVTSGKTYPLRSKGDAHDYRYFPEPDLLGTSISEASYLDFKNAMPELPGERLNRFTIDHNLSNDIAKILVGHKALGEFYEKVTKLTKETPVKVANFVVSEVSRMLSEYQKEANDSNVSPSALGELLDLIFEKKLSLRMGKEVFEKMFDEKLSAKEIVEREGLVQTSSSEDIEGICRTVFLDHQKEVDRYKSGEKKLLGFFMGQAMKVSGGKLNPQKTRELIEKLLES